MCSDACLWTPSCTAFAFDLGSSNCTLGKFVGPAIRGHPDYAVSIYVTESLTFSKSVVNFKPFHKP